MPVWCAQGWLYLLFICCLYIIWWCCLHLSVNITEWWGDSSVLCYFLPIRPKCFLPIRPKDLSHHPVRRLTKSFKHFFLFQLNAHSMLNTCIYHQLPAACFGVCYTILGRPLHYLLKNYVLFAMLLYNVQCTLFFFNLQCCYNV